MRDTDAGYEVGEVKVMMVTEKAMLVLIDDEEGEWIPFSQVHDNSELYEGCKKGDSGNLVVTRWFAEQREWM